MLTFLFSQFKIPKAKAVRDAQKANDEKKVFKNTVILSIGQSPLIKAKFHVFRTLALSLEPFLTMYQTSAPLIPFLFDDVKHLLNGLFRKVGKSDLLINEISTKKMIAFDFGKEENLLPIESVDIGFGAKAELKNVKNVSKKEVDAFYLEAHQFIIGTIRKILERSPVCLKPTSLIAHPVVAEKKMDSILQIYCEAGRISTDDADKIKMQFSDLVNSAQDWKIRQLSQSLLAMMLSPPD